MRSISHRQLALLCQKMATMLDAGLPIRRMLEALRDGMRAPGLHRAMSDVLREVEGGRSLAEAFRGTGRFPALFVNLIEVGEESGGLDRIAHELASYYEQQQRLRREFLARIILPAIEYAAAVAIISVAFYIIHTLSGEATHLWRNLAIGYGIPAALMVLYALRPRLVASSRIFQEVLLRVPVVGKTASSLFLARFSLVMHLMCGAGAPIKKALEYSLHATNSAAFAARFAGIAAAIEGGANLTEPLRQTGLFPFEFMEVLSVAEESGALAERFEWLADHYIEEFHRGMRALATVLAVLVWMIVAGIIIFFIFKIFTGYIGRLQGLGL